MGIKYCLGYKKTVWQLVNLPRLTEIIEKREQKFMDRLLELDYFTVVLKVYSTNVFLWFYLLLLFYHVYYCIVLA